jgi:hypothetical protein
VRRWDRRRSRWAAINRLRWGSRLTERRRRGMLTVVIQPAFINIDSGGVIR